MGKKTTWPRLSCSSLQLRLQSMPGPIGCDVPNEPESEHDQQDDKSLLSLQTASAEEIFSSSLSFAPAVG